jgi:hypothetical protein
LKAKNERLRAEIAMWDGVLNTPPGTNAINIVEEGISPAASLVKGVDPDADLSETGPPTNTSATKRAVSPTASLSKWVDPDTVPAKKGPPTNPDTDLSETGPPTNLNVTERERERELSNSIIAERSQPRYSSNRDPPLPILMSQREQSLQQRHYRNESIQTLSKQRLVLKTKLILRN